MEVEMVQSAKKKPQHALTEAEFVNALVRVGYAKFRRLLGVDDRLLWLLKHHVLEHEAVRIVDDPLPAVRGGSAAVAFATVNRGLCGAFVWARRALSIPKRPGQMMAKRKVKAVFAEHKEPLRQTFARYGEKVGGRPVISLGAFLGFLRACGLVDETAAGALTVRECRYIFLASNNDEDTAGEPESGGRAEDAIALPWEGFVHCIARMAREKDRLARALEAARIKMDKANIELADQASDAAPEGVFDAYIKDEFIKKSAGLDFWQLKKLAIGMKRVTKKNAAAKDPNSAANTRPQFVSHFKEEALTAVQLKHGLDVANILAEESATRTGIFSVLANVAVDMDQITRICAYLHDCGAGPEDVQFVAAALQAKGKLKAREKQLLAQYNIPTSPTEESAKLDVLLQPPAPPAGAKAAPAPAPEMTELQRVFYAVWLFYSTGGVFNRASPFGFLDGPGLQVRRTPCRPISWANFHLS
jgi:hypothetical protein